MPVGGIKENVLAAHRGNIKTVIIPKDNQRDLAEVPQNVQKALKIIFAEHIDEVLKIAFVQDEEEIRPAIASDVPMSSQAVN